MNEIRNDDEFGIYMVWARVYASMTSVTVSGTGVIDEDILIRINTFTSFLCASSATYRSDQSFVKYSFVKSEINLH